MSRLTQGPVSRPAYHGYFADPFVLATGSSGYIGYGTGTPDSGDLVFEALRSMDLVTWQSAGGVLRRPDRALGDDFWAPEVAHADGRWWMYYSVGHGDTGHHLRVATADSPLGPFEDLGLNLTPTERFAIDAHPFRDVDGQWYLFFARDVLTGPRPGTHLAVAPLASMTALREPTRAVLEPTGDWQLYERNRELYGARWDWHTLEGPSVVRRHGRYWLTYSAGAWTGPGYRVSWAVADSPLGPWQPAPADAPPLLSTAGDLIGPGHNSLTTAPDGGDVIAFHSWDPLRRTRRLHLHRIHFDAERPRLGRLTGES